MKKVYLHTPLFFLCVVIVFLNACTEKQSKIEIEYTSLQGLAQGTSFNIVYKDFKQRDFSRSIDSLLSVIDNSMSFYIDGSVISRCNNAENSCELDEHMLNVYWRSLSIFYETNGSFDPAVKPLVDFWGFGSDSILSTIDTAKVDSILKFSNIGNFKLIETLTNSEVIFMSDKIFEDAANYELRKVDSRSQLDFNAIAQGYTVDQISLFFEDKGVFDFMVEVGGEVRVRGVNPKGKLWTIGIDKPVYSSGERKLAAVLSLENKSVATSGNYRKYREIDGVKYSHTISPKTGFPVRDRILSATVVTYDCITADAYATALMVMGYKKAMSTIDNNDDIEGYIIYSDEKGNVKSYYSQGIKEIIQEKKN